MATKFTPVGRKPPANVAVLDRGHFLSKYMTWCFPMLGPGAPIKDLVSGRPIQLVGPFGCAAPPVTWTRAISTSGNAAYVGAEGNWCLKSGWVDNLGNLLNAPLNRVYVLNCTVVGGTTSVRFSYGGQNSAAISGGISASTLQSALQAMTSVGTQATVTGSNPYIITMAGTSGYPATFWPAVLQFFAQTGTTASLQAFNPTPQLVFPWGPITSKIQTVPTALTVSRVFRPANATTQITNRLGDSRKGLPFGTYWGLVANEFAIGYNTSSLQEYTFSQGDWLWVVIVYSGTNVDVYINGVHQTQITTGNRSNQWTQQIGTVAATMSQEE